MLGGGEGVAGGSVDHGYASAGGRIKIYVIHADASPCDHLELFRRRDNCGSYLGLASDYQGVIFAYHFQKLFGFHAGFHINIGVAL